ncbi:putative nascent polypeptide-associated complex subunit alpha [Gregarina niphandrodes]|uniref:Nascent polypeptide-associated complex subunit alpha n=1 Tax=Gregarina niphandrodes TaxID=110365 RepID=A0A023B0Y0_GRENI|nr:putative nascent polypeptide-associated complex subunit alpha [Gregarina niphandrodes]EZG46119.1 putative nascent polypeptide-associated complex subunit alpha [Gregarina niphandrodes]|eukprot:XP_011132375.1 putative nascent polypeptide-associated complex subunit alpha [Gregarina niphandrodes]
MSTETKTMPTMDNMSRSEKRAWKSLQRFGLEPVTDITKVEIRRPKDAPVIIDAPRVFKVPGAVPSYVVLGPLRIHNMQQELARTYQMFTQQQALAQSRAAAAQEAAAITADSQAPKTEAAPTEMPAVAAEPEVDTTGLDEEDIRMAVEQTGKTKKVVVETLRAHNGDLVETIMALTA